MKNIYKNQKGYITLTFTFLLLMVMLGIAVSMSFLATNSVKNVTNQTKSAQSYYAAESGIKDAMLKLKKNPQLSPVTYNLNVGNAVAVINIPATISASKAITSQSDNGGAVRALKIDASLDNMDSVSFYYGVEVGAGGLQMSNGSRVMGNVFSAGNVSGSGTIDNNLVVSGNGHSVNNVLVKGNVMAYSCLSGATVNGNLTYVSGGQHTCKVKGTTSVRQEAISEQPLPIPEQQINDWKTEAAGVEIISGNVTVTNGANRTLGPVKITGNLNVSNNATITLAGTVYVQGSISLSNNANVRLSSSFGSAGGILLAGGNISIANNVRFFGSGQPGSYILVLSTSTSDSAINISNNTNGAVFYTSAGAINISNGVSLIEAIGYKVIMNNNSTIQYSTGIVNIYFSSGVGGGWKVNSWQEQ